MQHLASSFITSAGLSQGRHGVTWTLPWVPQYLGLLSPEHPETKLQMPWGCRAGEGGRAGSFPPAKCSCSSHSHQQLQGVTCVCALSQPPATPACNAEEHGHTAALSWACDKRESNKKSLPLPQEWLRTATWLTNFAPSTTLALSHQKPLPFKQCSLSCSQRAEHRGLHLFSNCFVYFTNSVLNYWGKRTHTSEHKSEKLPSLVNLFT